MKAPNKKKCAACDGTGFVPGLSRTSVRMCDYCIGTGHPQRKFYRMVEPVVKKDKDVVLVGGKR